MTTFSENRNHTSHSRPNRSFSTLWHRAKHRRQRRRSIARRRFESLEKRELFAGDTFAEFADAHEASNIEMGSSAFIAETDAPETQSTRIPRSAVATTPGVATSAKPLSNQSEAYVEDVDAVFAAATLGEDELPSEVLQREIQEFCAGDPECGEGIFVEHVPLPSDSSDGLPPQFDQLRQEMGDEQFAMWLEQNQQQSGNLQDLDERQLQDLQHNDPDASQEFEAVESALQRWLDQWYQENEVSPTPDTTAPQLPAHVEQMRTEHGDAEMVKILVANILDSGNSLGQDPKLIAEIEETNPASFEDYTTTKQAVDAWLEFTLADVNADEPPSIPAEFASMPAQMGDAAFAEMLRHNLRTYGFFQVQPASGLDEGSVRQFQENEKALLGYVVYAAVAPQQNLLPVGAVGQKKVVNRLVVNNGDGSITTTETYDDNSKVVVVAKGNKKIRVTKTTSKRWTTETEYAADGKTVKKTTVSRTVKRNGKDVERKVSETTHKADGSTEHFNYENQKSGSGQTRHKDGKVTTFDWHTNQDGERVKTNKRDLPSPR